MRESVPRSPIRNCCARQSGARHRRPPAGEPRAASARHGTADPRHAPARPPARVSQLPSIALPSLLLVVPLRPLCGPLGCAFEEHARAMRCDVDNLPCLETELVVTGPAHFRLERSAITMARQLQAYIRPEA